MNNNTPTRRVNDVQIGVLIERVRNIERKIDNGISETLDKIWNKLDALPCAVHEEKFERIEEVSDAKINGIKTRVSWLYFAFAIVVLMGIILGLWVGAVKKTREKVSIAEGREGYRISQMIYRDLYEKEKPESEYVMTIEMGDEFTGEILYNADRTIKYTEINSYAD